MQMQAYYKLVALTRGDLNLVDLQRLGVLVVGLGEANRGCQTKLIPLCRQW